MVAGLQGHVTLVTGLRDVLPSPQDPVTPCRGPTFLTTGMRECEWMEAGLGSLNLAQVRLIGLWAWGRYADAVQLHTDVCEINVHRLNQPSPTHTHTTENIYSNK